MGTQQAESVDTPIFVEDACSTLRRGFTIRLKRLKPRAPNLVGPQNFGSSKKLEHFYK